jgi:hypothetical protein
MDVHTSDSSACVFAPLFETFLGSKLTHASGFLVHSSAPIRVELALPKTPRCFLLRFLTKQIPG